MARVGIVVHHTAGSRTGDAPSLGVVQVGRAGVPGPLANYYVSRSGVVVAISSGTANHAGRCSNWALSQMAAGIEATADAAAHGLVDNTVGNSITYGIEVEHPGDDSPYDDRQIASLVALCAQLCQTHDWGPGHVWHHREITKRKIDMSYRGPLRDMIRSALTQSHPQEQKPMGRMTHIMPVLMIEQGNATVWMVMPDPVTPPVALTNWTEVQAEASFLPGPFTVAAGSIAQIRDARAREAAN